MKVNDVYLAFLSAFESADKDFGPFFSDFQSYSASLQSDIERSLTEIVHLTGSVLPTYEHISATQYYAEYGSHQVQLRINGSGINKLFGGDITTGIVSVSSITVDYPSEAVHFSLSGSGISTNLDTGAISGGFRSFWFSTPLINVSAFGFISVAGSSVTSPLDVFGSLQNLSISYPQDSVLLSLVGKINYYQDALGKINYSGDLTEISLGKNGADLTIKGDLSCTFDDQNGLNLSGNTLTTGIISVSSIAVNYPSQSLHLAFSGLGSGISANLDTGAISGTFHSFHFTTPWLDVTASGSISVAGSSVLSSVNVVGALDALSITYPDEKFLLSILGDINYTQDASGQFHYDGGATEIRISKNGADLAIKGDFSCAFDEQHGLGLSGSVHEIDVQLGDVLIECIGDIRFGAKGVESADIQDLSILVNGNYYDASTLNLKDLLVDWVGSDMIYVDQNGDWCINEAKFPLFSDTIDYLLEKIHPNPPTVITFSPSDASTGVSVGSNIVLTFSEAIQAGPGAIEIHSGSATGALVAHYDAATSHNLTIEGKTLTINPTENLANGTHYFVTFTNGSVKDLAGNSFAGTATYDFTTAGGSTGISIDFNGTPVGTSSSYEVFQDFFFDTTKQSLPGYLGSVAASPNDISDMFDANNDGVADSFTITWTDSAGKAWLTSGTTTFDANGIWLSLATTGAFPSQTPHYGRLAFDAQGKVVGVYALNLNPVFTLTPDTIAGDKLVATFTIPNESGTWSLLDNDHNGVVDHLTNAANYFYNNVQQTNTEEYAITWSDTNHFTASRIDRKIDFGTTFDSQGRPTTITYYTHGATEQDGDVRNDVPIVWLAKGVDNVVATFSFTSSTNTASASGKFFDTNGDSIPDQISVIETDNGVTNTKTGRLYGWESLNSNHPIVSIEVITSTDPSEFFTGTITGTSSNPTTLAMPSYFMGSNGVEIAPNITAIVTTTANSGTGSLRSAIEYLNASGGNGSNIIEFTTSGTIVVDPDNPLPVITRPVSFVMDGHAVEVKLEQDPVLDGIPAVVFLAESNIAVTIPEDLTVTVTVTGSHKTSVLGSKGTLVLNEMAGVLNTYISDGDASLVYNSAAVVAENDVLVNGDVSGSITVSSNQGSIGIAANHDVLVKGNLSGKIDMTSSQGDAVAVGAMHDITIGGSVTSSAEIIVTGKNIAVGLGAPNGYLDIAGDMAGHVTVTSDSGVVYGVGGWQGSARLGSYSGTIIGTAKNFAVGLGVGIGYLATVDQQIPVLSPDAGNFTITNDFSGQVTLTSTDGFAIGVLAIQNLAIGGDLSGKVAVHAQNNAYALHSAEDMVIGSLSGDISAISENSYSFGLWAKRELHGATAQPLLISGTVSAVGNIAGAVVAGGAMNLIISGTLSCSTTSVTGSAFSIISILSNTNGYESATVSDQVTVTGTGKLVGNVEFGAGDDTMTLQAGADVTGVAFLDGGIGTDRLGFSGYGVVDLNAQSVRVRNFEIIDLTDATHNTLTISSADDVLKVTDANHDLYIVGDSGDSVRFSSSGVTFTSNGSTTINGVAYAHYIASSDSTVDLYVQSNLVVEFGDNNITINTTGSVGGAPQAGEGYYKFYSSTGVLATIGGNDFSLNLYSDRDNNPLTFDASWSWRFNSGEVSDTSTGVLTFFDTDTSKPGPELWSATFTVDNGLLLADGPDSDTLPDGFVINDDMGNRVNVPLVWHAKDANNVIATFTVIAKDNNNNDITFSGVLKDNNGDNQPDNMTATAGTRTFNVPFSFADTNSDGQPDHWVMQMSETYSGRVQVDASGNPAGLYLSNINQDPTGEVTISGTVIQGQALTADTSTLADADGLGTISYQWKAGGSDISGATSSTYTLTEAEVGKTVTVVASYTDGHATVEHVPSLATAAVANVNDAPTGSVTISGSATQGQTLTASNTLIDADGLGVISYQWQADGVTIAGAAGNTLLLGAAQTGKVITVQANYVDGHGTAEHVSSMPTALVVGTQSGIVQDGYLSHALVWVDANNDSQLNWNDINSNGKWDVDEGESWTLTDGSGQFTGLVGDGTVRITSNPHGSATNPENIETIDISTNSPFTGHYSAPSGSTVVNPLTTLVVAATAAALANNNNLTAEEANAAGNDAVKTALGLDANLDLSTYDALAEAAKTGSSSAEVATALKVQSAAIQISNIMDIATSVAEGGGASATDIAKVAADVASTLIGATPGSTIDLADSGVISDALNSALEHVITAPTADTVTALAATAALVNDTIVAAAAQTGGATALESLTKMVQAQIVAQDVAQTIQDNNLFVALTTDEVNTQITAASFGVKDIFTNHAPTGDVTMTGITTQGQTLTAHNTLADGDGLGSISYQWQSDGENITGATGATLALGEAQVNHQVRVVASYTDGSGTPESINSNAATILSQHAPTGSVTIDGTAQQGQTLTAHDTLSDADGLGAISYQWQSDGKDISGATNKTYLLTSSEVDKTIMVKESYTDGHGTAESVSSGATSPVSPSSQTYGITVNTKYWNNETSIKGVVLETGHQTGDTGSVTLGRHSAGHTTLSPALTADTAANGAVDLLDAIAILKSIVGLTTLNNYQQVAADFDKANGVDLNDAIGILKHVVGLTAPTPEWAFVGKTDIDPEHAISVHVIADTTVELVGILRGDVDGSWSTANHA